ncbi:GlxA family transcriptional regulator [Amphritea atlantica]|uniref:GlxA family transcriptional regulator n=1 Tax=Amphritea atlantica TaxID=355243 RepID=A0ABY5GRN3_9GAMM|nr:GlxA family transcriptional regulator [Amphritea atlantica]
MTTVTEPVRISFILLPGFALTSFSLAIEALSVANQLSDSELYRYRLCSPQANIGERVVSSNGVPIEMTATLNSCHRSELVFIAGYRESASYSSPLLTTLLRQINQRQGRIAALSSGAFILARIGLLKGRSCTLVPEHQSIFTELYPDILLQENLYTVTDNIFTSAGGTATLDMLLHLIGLDHGRDLVWRVSQQFMQDKIRSPEAMQATCQQVSLRIKSPCLGAAVELMQKHIEHPYPIAQLADNIGTTPRNLERVFQKHEHITPGRYYLRLRLQQARRMLEETHLSLASIAQATGFSSQSHFGKCFREQFNTPPSTLRKS